jgi:hypothetical protein
MNPEPGSAFNGRDVAGIVIIPDDLFADNRHGGYRFCRYKAQLFRRGER